MQSSGKGFLLILNGHNGIGDGGQSTSDFKDIFSLGEVFDVIVEQSIHGSSIIGIIGYN